MVFLRTKLTEGAIKNGQSRDIGNIGNARHKMKTNKRRNAKNTKK